MARLFLSGIILLFLTPLAHAQQSEEVAVKATISRLFEGMRKGDSALVHSAFHSTARLQTAYFDTYGKSRLEGETLEGFLKAIGTPHADVWDERLAAYEVKIDANLATAWAPYQFYLSGKYSHEGVDAFQLFRSAEGWKIIQICDTRKKK